MLRVVEAGGVAGGNHAIAWCRGLDPNATVRLVVTRPATEATSAEQLSETPDVSGAYPRLTEAQVAALAARGERRSTRRGEVLFREGDRTCDFYVILEGAVSVYESYGTPDERVIEVHGANRFLGDLSLLTGQALFVTAVVHQPGAVLVIRVDDLRALVGQDPTLGDLILRAYMIRRSIHIDLGTGLRIIGSRYSTDTIRLRELAARNRLPHRWIDLEEDPEAERLLQQLGVPPEDTPVVLWAHTVLRNPTNAELARVAGLRAPEAPAAIADLVVIGAGPAGLAAAVYGASEGLVTVVVDAVATGGQAGTTSRIENYLGFPAGISGGELAERAIIQAEKFGAVLNVPVGAVALEVRDGHCVVRLDDGHEIAGRTIVVATGARYRKLDVARLEQFEATSVFYAATEVEARVCVGDPVAVVGGGNAAGQAALFMADRAAIVRLLIRGDDLGKDMSRYLVDRIERHPRIEVRLRTEVRELVGDDTLEAVVVEDHQRNERERIEARALFVFIGAEPNAQWLANQVALDDHGFVLTGPDAGRAQAGSAREMARPPLPLETSQPGVFAVGDVRSGSVKRVAAAVGEGAMAVRLVHEHLDALERSADVDTS